MGADPRRAARAQDRARCTPACTTGTSRPTLGGYPLRELTPEIIGRWQADRLAAGAPVETTRKALTLLGGILQRAVEAGRIPSNPQRLVRKAAPRARPRRCGRSRPATVERICGASARPAIAMIVSLLAYAGLRPQEARGLRWGHVGSGRWSSTPRRPAGTRTQPRSVRLLAPLAQDLREWRLRPGAPTTPRR